MLFRSYQNKSTKKNIQDIEYTNDNVQLLDNFFEKNKSYKDSNNFNKWFNDKFEKHHVKEDEQGYGDWLKSDEGIDDVGNVSQANMGREMEKRKQRLQNIVKYEGVQESFSSTSLHDSNQFTDLRQAYVESVIPVTNEDYKKAKKFNNVNEYQTFRDSQEQSARPLSEQQANQFLRKQNQLLENESAAIGFKYAQDLERQKEQNNLFWSDMKRLH